MKYFLYTLGFFGILFLILNLPVWLASKETFSFYFVHTYYSSPGYVTYEDALEFERSKELCKGVNFLLNRGATYVDAPGVSLCIGLLSPQD